MATRQNLTQAKCTMFRKHKKLFQNKLETKRLLLLFLPFYRLCIRILVLAIDTL